MSGIRLEDYTLKKRQEMLNIFMKKQEFRKEIGGCPHEKDRVKGYSNCFYCDECWIEAIKNSFDSE